MKGHKTLYCLLTLIMGLGETAAAFNPPRDVVGPLSVEITAPDKVADLDKPVDATISLANSGTTPLEVRLEIWGVDEWRFGAQKAQRIERTLRLAAGAKEQVALSLTAGLETHNAHYPIHARGTFTDPASGEKRQAHAIKIFLVEASRSTAPAGPVAIKAGVTSLVRFRHQSVALWSSETGTTRALGAGWRGTDDRTGAVFNVAAADRGGRLESLSVHPPWRKKWGTIWADYDLILPITKPITLTFSTAIRDTGPDEPPGDGVEFKVIVIERKDTGEPATSSAESAAGAPTLLFTRLAKSKKWEPASVDLSAYAGKPITLRFWNGPGPANNTICDSGYWGNPAISVGAAMPPTVREPKQVMTGIGKAWDYGTEAWGGKVGDWTWQLKSKAGAFGASLYPSSEGIPDIVVALAQDKEALIFDGFTVQVDNVDLKTIPLSPKTQWRSAFANGRGVIEGDLLHNGQSLTVRMEVWAESGALRFRFSMPRVKRDKRGHPRFTLIGLGRTAFARKDPPPSRAISALVGQAKRVYAGFGNVIEEPKRFDLSANGFRLSTRHVGVDYGNGLSLVQASDVFPDRFHIDPEQHTYSLQVHHDATISLIPSEKGAFAAAEVYRDGIAGFRPAAGVARLLGRMCLDYWGMSYEHGIATVETLAKYGVTDCVYVWHNWQRWGYDYRLPEIYPARGDHAQFVRLAGTCRKRGILFCPHDNYIDFYPDADGFSYDHIIFNEDGTPQRAWFNKGRNAQSYRWLPHAFQPWLKKNIALLKRDVKPTAYFIDVFTAIEPMDYYDRSGRFYPKTETIRRWSECWDYVRRQLRGAPMISEAGSDSQIGHLDAGESDHNAAAPQGSPQWGWNVQCADAERTPWHDMASHGSFILFA
ncbi:hypothetical protein FJY63_01805, partial [Candidatus Sumerlaeota bacterium]|nr:hypothetical protein [Candidatus Sumerlaeota bacterium]